MKRCPACNRAYPDDAQNFCLDDGTTLVSTGAPQQNPYVNRAAATEVMYPAPATERIGAPAAVPFASYTQPKKSALPLILGVVGVLVVGIIITIVLVLKKSSSPASWETLNGDKFSASLPGTATKTEQMQPTAAGQIPIKMYTLDKGTEAYIVGYLEYPSTIFTTDNADAILDRARDGAINNVHGQVVNEHAISQGSYVGREITGKSPSQNVSFTTRLYLANPRMYMLIYLKQGDEPISDNGRKFLDSFKISGQ